MKDWTGNGNSIYKTLGASNHTQEDREENDYYATHPDTTKALLDVESFTTQIWECACGEGHISEVLKENGYKVVSTDLVDRGYGQGDVDFLKIEATNTNDIITNPPYKYADQFVEHALDISVNGVKVAMLLKIQFLEGQKRRGLFEKYPPRYIYVFSKRQMCGKNGNFEGTSAVCYAWFIWEKGFNGAPVVKWI